MLIVHIKGEWMSESPVETLEKALGLHMFLTTRKTIALTIWIFVSKVMSLLSNMLSRFVIAFLPRNKHLLISWHAVAIHSDFGAQENKICHCFNFLPFYLP